MSLSPHDRHKLGAIEEELAASDPRLAGMLSTFSRLVAGEAMPRREQARSRQRPFGPVPDPTDSLRAGAASRPARRARLSWQVAVLVWLAISLALIAIALTVPRSGASTSCAGWPAAGCGNRAPARQGNAP